MSGRNKMRDYVTFDCRIRMVNCFIYEETGRLMELAFLTKLGRTQNSNILVFPPISIGSACTTIAGGGVAGLLGVSLVVVVRFLESRKLWRLCTALSSSLLVSAAAAAAAAAAAVASSSFSMRSLLAATSSASFQSRSIAE